MGRKLEQWVTGKDGTVYAVCKAWSVTRGKYYEAFNQRDWHTSQTATHAANNLNALIRALEGKK